MKRNLSRHRQWEQDEGFQWTAWQAEKLRNVSSFRRECSAIMGEYTDVIDKETRQLMEEQFAEGEKLGEKSVSESIGDIAQLDRQPAFFGIDRTKLDNLIQEVTVLEKHVETAALRMTDDVYRQTLNRVQLAMASGSMTLNQAIDLAVKDFLDKGINCIVYRYRTTKWI
ncbi:MAG: phage minor capsid protein [Ruminococcus sp.]